MWQAKQGTAVSSLKGRRAGAKLASGAAADSTEQKAASEPGALKPVLPPQMSDTGGRKRQEQERHQAALRQIGEDRRDRQERQARQREADLAASMAADTPADEGAAEQAVGSSRPQESLERWLDDKAPSDGAGRPRRRHVTPSSPDEADGAH